MGVSGEALRAAAAPSTPEVVPALSVLLARVDDNVAVLREQADVHASEARVNRERALVRPGMTLDVGADFADPSLNYETNYRAQLAIDVPLFNQRGAFIDRERATGDVARARVAAARVRTAAELRAAYRLYEAATVQQRAWETGVVPAAQTAARATEEAYALGRAPLLAVLDAERALVDARVAALEAQGARATAWADIEHAVGGAP
jgi:cobalt-zinc-cadmium efflux system outer membrane protein